MATISQTVNIEMLEKLPDGTFKRKYPKTSYENIVGSPTMSRTARFVIGTSTAGWTAADCDYLCDGTADQVEISAALNALPAGGGEVVILDGTYNITASINIPKDNVSIRGNGNATILKRMFNSSVNEGVITLTSRSDCKISNLQVDGNKVSYASNNSNNGIQLNESSNNTITGSTNSNNSNNGIQLNESSDNAITGNTCNNNNSGIYLESSNNNTVTGNTCNNSNYGIQLNESSNNTITGSTNNNNGAGIRLESSSSNNTITGNTCTSNNYGISLYASSNNTITGNTCTSNNYGISLYASSNNTITGSTCTSNNYGISLNKSSNNTVTGNTCIRGTGQAGDYTTAHTIWLRYTDNHYNLIATNNCMGKAVTNEGGTGNTLVNNKFDAT